MNHFIKKMFNLITQDDIDAKNEQQQKEIYQIFASGYTIVYWMVWLMTFVGLFWDIYTRNYVSLSTFFLGILFIIQHIFVMKALDKYSTTSTSTDKYQHTLYFLKIKCVIGSIAMMIIMLLIFMLTTTITSYFKMSVLLIIGGIGFGILMYYTGKRGISI